MPQARARSRTTRGNLRPDVADRLHPRLHDAFLQLGGDEVQALGRADEALRRSWLAAVLQDLVAGQDELADEVHQLVEQTDVDADVGVRQAGALLVLCFQRVHDLRRLYVTAVDQNLADMAGVAVSLLADGLIYRGLADDAAVDEHLADGGDFLGRGFDRGGHLGLGPRSGALGRGRPGRAARRVGRASRSPRAAGPGGGCLVVGILQAGQGFDERRVVRTPLTAVVLNVAEHVANGVDRRQQGARDFWRELEQSVTQPRQKAFSDVGDRLELGEAEKPARAFDGVDRPEDRRQRLPVARILLERYQVPVKAVEVLVALDEELGDNLVELDAHDADREADMERCTSPTVGSPGRFLIRTGTKMSPRGPMVRRVPTPGPAGFGRGVVIRQGALVPDGWERAPLVVVDDAALVGPAAVVGALHRAWSDRQPIVVALGVESASFRAPRSYPGVPWGFDADFELWHDRLHFLVWANTYDGLGDGPPVWWWARKAVRLGATLGEDTDVVLPDGRAAWIDGGPGGPIPIEACVVHRETVELGLLEPVPLSVPAPEGGLLAADQLAAVRHSHGPAGSLRRPDQGRPASGTERLRHLIVDRRYERDTVLAVAYNVKARHEMEARTAAFSPRLQSLNALGYSLVREARRETPPVLDERGVRRLVEKVMPRRPRRANVDPYAVYLDGLSAIRLGLRDPDEVEASLDDAEGLSAGFTPYREALAAEGALDFDEQIYAAIEELLSDGDFRRRAQQRCRHLLVDEFQDLTPAHVLLLRLLATPELDVFGVGDDDQVIYGHAGADPAFLVGFERLFPGAASHPLEVNYRCPVRVVDVAGLLLSYNQRRVLKTIRPGPAADAAPDAFTVRRHGPQDGATVLVAIVRDWLAADEMAPRDIAVLARVNSLLLAPHVALFEAGVPVDSSLGPEVLRRTGVRAALAYLRLGCDPDAMRGADIVEILRRPSRGLPPWFADRLGRRKQWSVADLHGLLATMPSKDAGKLEGLLADLQLTAAAVAGGDTATALAAIRDAIGLGRAMTLLDGQRGGEGSSNLDDLDALAQVAALHPDPEGFEPWLRSVLERPGTEGGVTLSTIHRVKGREWDRVAVFGVTGGVVPHRLAEDEEEERRVLHVAITRARHRVVVLADATRPSPFLTELDGTREHRRLPASIEPSAGVAPSRLRAAAAQHARATLDATLEPEAARRDLALRTWRTERCRRDGIPAYIVFSNAVLASIAREQPRHAGATGPHRRRRPRQTRAVRRRRSRHPGVHL